MDPSAAWRGHHGRPASRRAEQLRRILWLFALPMWLGAAESIPLRTAEGFAVPQPGQTFRFPRDHGSHPEFALEWWYLTGHLVTEDQRPLGFQATFFRRAAPRAEAQSTNAPSLRFGTDQLFLAHMALVEGRTGRFQHQERLNREGWDASAATNRLEVRNGNWSLRAVDEGAHSAMELRGSIDANAAFQLRLEPRQPLVVFGTNGVSRKAADPTASSHYLTYPRLATVGSVTLDGQARPVRGEAWMDHEFSSSQLGAGQVGWDWASIQLQDGRSLMAYRMRRRDGSTDPFSTVAFIDADSTVRHVGPDHFRWEILSRWTSPVTRAEYPSRLRLTARDPLRSGEEAFELVPLVADQELRGRIGGIAYWEGACRVLDRGGREIGRAYLELTGYAGELGDRLGTPSAHR